MLMLPVVLAIQAMASQAPGPRTPSVAADGRITVAVAGDIWVMDASGGSPSRLTSGPSWDRDPAWVPDGSAIVFSSDRAGGFDLWRVVLNGGGLDRLTSSPEPETEPTVGPDGAIVYVRGAWGDADLWRLDPAGGETRLTDEPGAERSPAYSRQGELAYVAVREAGSRIRIHAERGRDREIVTDFGPTRLAWSPDGKRLVFGTRGRRPGIWVTTAEGEYLTQASTAEGSPAWAADGAWLIVSDPEPLEVGYNGDPDRQSVREGGDVSGEGHALRRIRAPSVPDDAATPLEVAFDVPRPAHNADVFDRAWDRTARLYFGWTGQGDTTATASLRAWRNAARRYRPVALAAGSDEKLDDAVGGLVAARPATRAQAVGRAAVSSAHPLATAAGVEILEAGGNVVDAAVAVSFALGVVEPDASGPGGYGEALIRLAGMEEPTSIEFMTRVPEAATAQNAALRNLPSDGPMKVNVPGTVAGMGLAWERYGSKKVSWARILEPAIRIAENGYVVSGSFATTLRREREAFSKYESSRKLFFPNGRPLAAGDTFRNPDLARTLREIAAGGAAAFYRGDIAKRLVEDLHAGGNPIALSDMASYYAAERRPVMTTYRGHSIYSGPPPVTGGVSLVAKLNLLEQAPAGTSITADAAKLHAMIEAWSLQPPGRVGDPDMVPVDVSPFESKDTARARWACFDPDHAGTGVPGGPDAAPCGRESASGNGPVRRNDEGAGVESGGAGEASDAGEAPCDLLPDGGPPCRSTGTTAFAVADADGNMVAVTQTLGTWGGNFYVSPGLGFLYNDKMTQPRSGNQGFGSVPLARVGTVIAPTLIFEGTGAGKRPLMALGAAGNAWITSAVYEMVVGVIDHGLGPQQALELPRFLPGGRNGPIQIEDGFSPAVMRRLAAMGHEFRPISRIGELRMGYGAAVLLKDGKAIAGADPRRSGTAGAVR
jgi:gamma-glutamyltranspeptidase / glutathione hydrolase